MQKKTGVAGDFVLNEKEEIGENYFIGNSPQAKRIRQITAKVCQRPRTPLLITGETGTGKERVVGMLRYHSGCPDEKFVSVNCSAIPEHLWESEFFGHRRGAFTGANEARKGYVEQAQGGILFLDEISTLKPALQQKLLRFLQDGSYMPVGETKTKKSNARVIAASNENLPRLIRQGRFRKDLFYRLKVVEIKLPPLRERKEDILLLVEFFIELHAKRLHVPPKKLSPAAHKLLLDYNWPGNVRQLKNLIQSLTQLVSGKLILPKHLPAEIRRFAPKGEKETSEILTLEEVEKQHIAKILEKNNYAIRKTARQLRIARSSLKRKMEKYGIEPKGR